MFVKVSGVSWENDNLVSEGVVMVRIGQVSVLNRVSNRKDDNWVFGKWSVQLGQ